MDKVRPVTKEHLIMLLSDIFGVREPDYSQMHIIVKNAQKIIENKYMLTTGYTFNDPSLYSVWSDELQSDIERYDALGLTIKIKDDRIIGLTNHGEFLKGTNVKRDLEKTFGNYEELVEELKKCA